MLCRPHQQYWPGMLEARWSERSAQGALTVSNGALVEVQGLDDRVNERRSNSSRLTEYNTFVPMRSVCIT